MPRRMKFYCSIGDWSQEIVVHREDKSKGTLYKSKGERSGLAVKTMDKVSLVTKVHLFWDIKKVMLSADSWTNVWCLTLRWVLVVVLG